MSTNRCHYCNCRFTYEVDNNSYTCAKCLKVVEKFDGETLCWLMMVIDEKIEKAVNHHTYTYKHESEGNYY